MGAHLHIILTGDLILDFPSAENAILTGSSAGGLATILNCDKFKSFFHDDSVKVKCVAFSGFFINISTITGTPNIQKTYERVVELHESAKNLPSSCTSVMEPTLINNTLVSSNLDPQGAWKNCNIRISDCTPSQRTTIKGFGVEFLKAFLGLPPCNTRGYFITSCRAHPDIIWPKYWFGNVSILNKTIAEAVGDWYFEKNRISSAYGPTPFC